MKLRRERRLIPANSATYPRAWLAWALSSNWYIFIIITYILAACTYCLSLFLYAAEIFSHHLVAAILAKFLSVSAQCLGFLMGFSSNFERASLFVGALMPWGTTSWKYKSQTLHFCSPDDEARQSEILSKTYHVEGKHFLDGLILAPDEFFLSCWLPFES